MVKLLVYLFDCDGLTFNKPLYFPNECINSVWCTPQAALHVPSLKPLSGATVMSSMHKCERLL